MSDEKRQTRLLPFRLRGKASRRGDGLEAAVPADEELRALLGAWRAPEPSCDARAHLLAAFREQARERESVWKRLLTSSVRVPVPVAACALVVFAASVLMLAARSPRLALDAPAAVGPAPEIRIVEAPAPKEKVTTRVVYVERESRRADGERVGRLASRARAEGSANSNEEGTTSYFTSVDMGEFQPPDEMKIRIVKRGKADED